MNRHFTVRLLNRLGILPYLNGRTRIKVNGLPIKIPLMGVTGLNNLWLTEAWLIDLIARLLEIRAGLFVDVGTNIGQTLIKVKSVNARQPYIGFEPNPICVAYLEALIRVNHFNDCQVVPVGLAEKPAVLPLFSRNHIDSAASLVDGFRDRGEYASQQYVTVQCFDHIAESVGISDMAIFKVDVEGAEVEVLTGAREMLAKSRPFILCEILPVYDETSERGRFRKARQIRVEGLLKELSYGMGRIDHITGKMQLLEAIETHSTIDWCDYLFFPLELRDSMARNRVIE
jgi:FkbM family methyltransferase